MSVIKKKKKKALSVCGEFKESDWILSVDACALTACVNVFRDKFTPFCHLRHHHTAPDPCPCHCSLIAEAFHMKQMDCSWAPLGWHHLRQTHTHTYTQMNTDQSLAFHSPKWCHSCCLFSAAFCIFFQSSIFVLMLLSLRIAFYQLACCGGLAVTNLSVWI